MDNLKQIDAITFDEIQLLLAEKRTSLSVMRTGIAVLALPMSVVSVLIATSKYYNIFNVLYLFIPLAILNTALVSLGIYLIVRSVSKMKKYDMYITKIKQECSSINELLD